MSSERKKVDWQLDVVEHVDAMEIDEDGRLILYRRRGPFAILRRRTKSYTARNWSHATLDRGRVCRIDVPYHAPDGAFTRGRRIVEAGR